MTTIMPTREMSKTTQMSNSDSQIQKDSKCNLTSGKSRLKNRKQITNKMFFNRLANVVLKTNQTAGFGVSK